ncbi:hypothetical protein J6S88_02770 [bacterium]|nr:hypothetical protein [bacterium]
MNISSIDKFSESSSSLGRLKYRGQSVHDRHMAESCVGAKNSYEDKSGRVMNDNNSAAFNFKGGAGLLGKEWVGNLLVKINEHNQITNAIISFIMAGILRPMFTMQLKVDEKKDKVLATFHSISSAVLGLLVTMGITHPIDNAIKDVHNKPDKYANKVFKDINNEIETYLKNGFAANSKEVKHLTNKKAAIELIAKNFPEWVICIPRAMLTVALIPVFMKGITSIHNKLSQKDKNNAQKTDVKDIPDNKQKTAKLKDTLDKSEQDVSFKGHLSDKIAKRLVVPFMNSKFVKNTAEKFADNMGFIYDTIQMVASFAISATYAIRSYKNTKLDSNEKNRKVLALNHFTTWAISTAISLMTLKRLSSWWQRNPMAKLIVKRAEFASETARKEFVKGYADKQAELLKNARKTKGYFNRYKAKNDARKYSAWDYYMDQNPLKKDMTDAEKAELEKLTNMLGGLSISQRQVVWGTVTRLLVPLCSTVFASKLGRKVINKREAKQEAARQAEQQQLKQVDAENKNLEKLIKDVEIEETSEA